MKFIDTDKAPAPSGHYSQAIVHNGLIFVSGLLPVDPATGKRVMGGIEDQTEQVLNNLKAVLDAAGSGLMHVINVRVYVSDVKFWGTVNEVYARKFGNHKPTRSVVPTAALHYGFDIELDAIAAESKE
jgi:2-iminobutanoate/2-iminopropanoate deaminase